MCSICLPQSGQALRLTSAGHISRCAQRKLSKQIPSFTMSISKTPALCKAAKLVTEVSTAKRRNTTLSWNGGARRDRTDDLKLAKLPLSQLSYGPVSPNITEANPLGPTSIMVGLGRFELPTSRLSSARSNQLSYKPGTTGDPGAKTIRTVLRPREKEKRRRRCSANGPVTFRP